MKTHYQVVVIGGGVVGAGVLYHLAKLGWTDIALVEREVLTVGSSWHAAGGFHALNADPSIAALQAYTIDLLSRLTQQDISNEALPFMACRELDVGTIRARVGRLSVAGELGYEIHCPAVEHIALRRSLLAAGADLGVTEYGYNALLSLRLEKSFGIWSTEFTQGYTPAMTGMDRWIDWSGKDFIGREAALREREAGATGDPW